MKLALESAAQIGMSFLEFWEITPYEFSLKVSDYIEKYKAEHDNRITMAYLGAYLQRVEKMPKLDTLLMNKEPVKQTPESMLEKIKQLNSAFGGEVT